MSTTLSTEHQPTLDAGHTLLAEQQRYLSAIEQGAHRGDVRHALLLDIRGALQVPRLQQALDSLLPRHPLLCSGFVQVAGYHGLRQVPGAGVQSVALSVQAEVASEAEIKQHFQGLQQRQASLADAALAAVLQRVDQDHWQLRLSLAAHVGDAGSLHLLADQLFAAYEHGSLAVDEDAGQFAQYLDWRSEVLFDEDADSARNYWQHHVLVDGVVPSAPDLPYRAVKEEPAAAAQFAVTIEPAFSAHLSQLAGQRGTSVAHLLQAAWWVLLARISGREVFSVGWRHDARGDYAFFADACGVFEKTLPLVVKLVPTQPFAQWLDTLTQTLEQHSTWQEYWSAQAYPELAMPSYGFSSRTAWQAHESAGLSWAAQPATQGLPSFELILRAELDAGGDAQHLILEYSPQHYSLLAAQVLLEQYKTLLRGIVANADQPVGELNLLSESERARLLAFNPASAAIEQPLLGQRIAEWARSTPHALALADARESLSYAELERRAEALAAQLAQLNVGAGSLVGLALPRSSALIVAMLASWKVGAAYVPLDPQWPVARQAQVLELAGVVVLLADDDALPVGVGEAVQVVGVEQAMRQGAGLAPLPARVGQGRDVAYVLFTSGSTGVPKGVVIEQRHVCNYTVGVSQLLGLHQRRHFAFSSTVAADLGNTTLFGALFNGAALHVADDQVMQDPQAFAAFMRDKGIDCLKIVPSHLAALLEATPAALPGTLILGGEAPGLGLIQRIRQIDRQCRIFNHYGPTEATVGVLLHELGEGEVLDAGVPLSQVLPGNQVYVLDDRQRLAAPGELGELYIGGAQVCRGYLNASQDVFIASPFQDGERLYRSGDLARYRLQGGLQLQGRRDDQVKVRGFRIELAEIETQLASLPQVSEAVVVMAESGEPQAFVVALPTMQTTSVDWSAVLKAELALRLPAAMQPRALQVLPAMPRLPNGKVDRKALRGYQVATPLEAYVAPRDALEELLAVRMAQLLGLERLSATQDFFAAGGHSLLVIKLVAGIRKLLNCEIHPGVVFDHPSPAGLAQTLRSRHSMPEQLEKLANARLRLDAMTPEQKAALLERAKAQAD